ncbi:hypothetical protein HPB52_021621 [Rhipicephalus sanguineus]|uniref:Tc1-like transposase DDE domain-containing protein n=2 Tax=Rhipicephalus sanguineus TaxID=34632 RepID=A0A9D4Q2Z3_RHISA|nr:hypothetical protein HPB52_021621 [Rhipicephalus sanguineus]
MAIVPENERWEIVELYFKGRSQRKIAEATGRTLKTVNKIVRAFKSCRRIKDAPRKPRSRVTTEQEDAWIVAAAAVEPATPPGSGSEEQDCSPIASSSRSDQRKTAAVFSTACPTYQPKFLQRVSKSGRSTVSVWGMITKDGLGPLVRIDGKFTANKYCEILTTVAHRELAKVHFSGAGPVFQHDRSPVHTSKKVEALLRQLNIAVLEWPPQSPDFNIIENIWGQMKAALASKPLHGTSRDSIWRAVHAEWERLKLDATLVDSLNSSLPRRMAAAIASGGDATRY